MKTLWIIDHYSTEPAYGGISRQFDFASELSKRGHHVIVIASAFSHFTHNYLFEKEMFISEVNEKMHYVYLKTTPYLKNNGLGRFRNMFSFQQVIARNRKKLLELYGKPDVITGCSVHPFSWIAAYQASKKFGARFCIEVRDLWPEVWVLSAEKKPYDPMVLFFRWLEKWAYRKAERIIYSMPFGDRYLCDRLGVSRKKTFLIGQPMDCQRFDDYIKTKRELIPNEIRAFIKDSFVCVFAGYYMDYEGVYTMLEAAKILKEKGLPIKMVFVGSGQEENGMKAYVKEHALTNVWIGSRISKEGIPALLASSKICLAHLAIEGRELAYQYGVSKNKVNEYLYSGACTLYGFLYKDDPVASSGGGYVFEPFNSRELAMRIEEFFKKNKEEQEKYGSNGRCYINEHHRVEILADKMERILFN